MSAAFTRRRVERLAPRIQRIADELLDGFAGTDGIDLIAEYAYPLPIAGARHLCLHAAVMPPGARAQAHLHRNHESAVFIVEGDGEMWSGDDLAQHDVVSAGDFIYIPAGVPHLPANRSTTHPLTIVVTRTDPNEQENVVLLPELDSVADAASAGRP